MLTEFGGHGVHSAPTTAGFVLIAAAGIAVVVAAGPRPPSCVACRPRNRPGGGRSP